MRSVVGECGAVSLVSEFPASEALSFSNTFFPFFLGEFSMQMESTSIAYGLTLEFKHW